MWRRGAALPVVPNLRGAAFISLQPVGGYDKASFCLVEARGLISDDVFLFQALSSLKEEPQAPRAPTTFGLLTFQSI